VSALAASRGSEAFTGLPRSTIHELRTPLTSIRGYAQLLLRGVRSHEQAQRAYETIYREADRLAALLDQLSKVSEARSSFQPESTRFDLEKVTRAAVEQAQARWPEHLFTYQGGPVAPVQADPRRVEELLAILFDNAAGYSAPGSTVETLVTISGGSVCVAVRDHGIGIPPDELEVIFECFQRASNAPNGGPNGSRGLGVGLFLARAVAGHLGGSLRVESELNRGSTFYFALPLLPSERVDELHASPG